MFLCPGTGRHLSPGVFLPAVRKERWGSGHLAFGTCCFSSVFGSKEPLCQSGLLGWHLLPAFTNPLNVNTCEVCMSSWCIKICNLLTVYLLCVLVHLVDIWNMIEAFRDNGLNTLDHSTEISVSRLETVISSIYYQLNKRLPSTHQISVDQSISLLLNFMIAAYDRLVPHVLAELLECLSLNRSSSILPC